LFACGLSDLKTVENPRKTIRVEGDLQQSAKNKRLVKVKNFALIAV
jgi:hypothetical protein